MIFLLLSTTGLVASLAVALLIVAIGLRFNSGASPRTGAPADPAAPRAAPALPTELPPGVVEALAAGRRIDAIKAYRHAIGCGLKEAKDACEELERMAAPPR